VILRLWVLVEADLQDHSVDVGDRRLMRSRTWRWLKVRIEGLLSIPPALSWTPDGHAVWVQQTRLGLALDPPDLQGGRR